MSLYYELFNQSGRPLAIENCHQGLNFTDGGNPDQMGPGWCPYNWFRTSGDVVNLWDRVISNLMTVAPFLQPPKAAPKGAAPLSRPGCWAYPDMLEVGPHHAPARTLPAPRPSRPSRPSRTPCTPRTPHPAAPHPAPCRTARWPQVGRMPEHNAAESRSHFSAWAVVSAPLILGFDLSDEAKVAAAWPVISNRDVIAISQQHSV